MKPPKELNTLFKFTVRKEVYVFIYAVILLDCINSTVSIVAEYVPLIGQEKMTLHIINAVYVTVYITEVVLKVRLSALIIIISFSYLFYFSLIFCLLPIKVQTNPLRGPTAAV